MTADVTTLLRASADALRPDSAVDPAAWADAHRILTTAETARPGRWRTLPFQREPLARLAAGDPCQRVVLMWPAQAAGKTEIGLNWLGYTISSSPCPIMFLEPTLADAEMLSKQRIKHLVDAPALRGLVADPRARDSGNTLLAKEFPGGVCYLAGANSPAGLAGKPMGRLIADEVDRYPPSAGTEGDPLELARKRLSSWGPRAKELVISTPTVKGDSRIETEYLASTQGEWEVPCPHCGAYQPLDLGTPDTHGLRWRLDDDRQIADVWYECRDCHARIDETAKGPMLAAGRWTHAHPERPTWGGHMTALSAPVGSVTWGAIAGEWLAATARAKVGDTSLLRVFLNTRLAQPWEDRGEQVDVGKLELRAEPKWERLPIGVRVLTAGVDTHDDRYDVSIYGWGVGLERWLVGHFKVMLDPQFPESAQALDAALLTPTWEREDGARLIVASVCVDAGGHRTQNVLEYASARHRRRRGVVAIIGARVQSAPIWKARAGKSSKVKGGTYHVVGRHASADAVQASLRITQPGPGYLHVQDGTPAYWYAEMTAQKLVRSTVQRGRDKGRHEWHYEPVTSGADDHAWDCARLALAAMHRLVSMGLQVETTNAPRGVEPAPVVTADVQPVVPSVDISAKTVQPVAETVRPAKPKRRMGALEWSRREFGG